MRLQLSAALAALLIALGLVTLTPTAATASGGLQCNIGAVDSAASSLQSSRTFLNAHRSTSSWKRYVPRVSATYSNVAECFTGSARTLMLQSLDAFLGHYRAKHWSKGIAQLDATIKVLRRIVNAYYDSDGDICPTYC